MSSATCEVPLLQGCAADASLNTVHPGTAAVRLVNVPVFFESLRMQNRFYRLLGLVGLQDTVEMVTGQSIDNPLVAPFIVALLAPVGT